MSLVEKSLYCAWMRTVRKPHVHSEITRHITKADHIMRPQNSDVDAQDQGRPYSE